MSKGTAVKKKQDPKWLVNPKGPARTLSIAGEMYYPDEPVPASLSDIDIAQLIREGMIYQEGTVPKRPVRPKPIVKMRNKRDDVVEDHDEWRESAVVPDEFEDEERFEINAYAADEDDDDGDPDEGELVITPDPYVDRIEDDPPAPVKRKRGRPRKVVANG